MHITASCPFCRTGYQVQETLRGQMVRCPNAACRKVFPVPHEEAPPGNGQRAGSVGDMVPMLPSERALPSPETTESSKHVSEMIPVVPSEPAAPTEKHPAEGDWWQAAPPVRATPSKPIAPPTPAPADPTWWREAPPAVRKVASPIAKETTPRLRPVTPPASDTQPMPVVPDNPSGPRELPPGAWEAPPVRRGAAAPESIIDKPDDKPTDTTHQPRVSKRGACVLIAALFFLTFGILGGVGAWVWVKFSASEEERLAEARGEYEQGFYSSAAGKFRDLAQKYPNSAHAAEYRFLAEWSAVCADASNPEADPADAAAKVENFLKEHKTDPLMVERAHEAVMLTLKLTQAFAARNAQPADDTPLKGTERIEALRRAAVGIAPDALTKEESGRIDADLDQVRRAVALARKRRAVLAELSLRAKETPMEAIKRVRLRLAQAERELPGIGKDAEALAALTKLYDTHFASVVYRPRDTEEDAPPPPARPVDDAETVLFAPLLNTAAPGRAAAKDPIVLALARGVLYALRRGNGELKWATRVGPDTTVLPLRIPPEFSGGIELILVLSADTQSLSALNDKGDTVWEYFVGQPVLGRPILIGPRAYLAAYDGTIHEIELARGQQLGRWSLGQRLTCGGAREGNTSRIYFPADDSCVYVLDVQARRCVTVLYDGHPSGSLRSEPVVIPPEGDAPGYLILNQASGLDNMRLRVFELPLQDRHSPELPLKPPARFSGWTWFAPKQDGEKLAIVSDAGTLGLFGIRQQGNQDQALFPFLQPGGLDLSPFLQTERDPARERGRSQVVSMQGDDLWVLAHGRLQQLELRLQSVHGPQAKPRWPKPLTLGSPLHASQRVEDRDSGRSTFFLVTQAQEQQICLASAVDERGKVLWQRQLGLVCQGEPLALTPPDGGAATLVALDRGGGLFALDPPPPPDKPRPRYLAPAFKKDNPLVPPYLLRSADGHSAYEVAAPGEGAKLLVRHITFYEGERRLRVTEREASLQSQADNSVLSLAGPPVLADSQLLLPLSDGSLKRFLLTDDAASLEDGPAWRDRSAPPSAVCNLLPLGGGRVLATDGGRQLSVWDWPSNKNSWQLLEPLKPLDYLITTPPILLPSRDGVPPRVIVGDSANILHLFVVTPDGALQPGATWDLPGKITAGPFVRTTPQGETRLGCILDQRHLLWIDPNKTQPAWTYSAKNDALVGQPQLVDDVLVAALHSGRYLALDPVTGQPKGDGYTLRASAAPAAAPTAFAAGQLFAPLSDGTALIISLSLLQRQHP